LAKNTRNLRELKSDSHILVAFKSHVIIKRAFKKLVFQKKVGSYSKSFESEINISGSHC
jgi:hypothetical protein